MPVEIATLLTISIMIFLYIGWTDGFKIVLQFFGKLFGGLAAAIILIASIVFFWEWILT